ISSLPLSIPGRAYRACPVAVGSLLGLSGHCQAIVGPVVWLVGIVEAAVGLRTLSARLDSDAGVPRGARTPSRKTATGHLELRSSRFCTPTNLADEVAAGSGGGWRH
ncbi:hypothetical protein Droror1_Dr00027510, partial [Drosera rotundifolia]